MITRLAFIFSFIISSSSIAQDSFSIPSEVIDLADSSLQASYELARSPDLQLQAQILRQGFIDLGEVINTSRCDYQVGKFSELENDEGRVKFAAFEIPGLSYFRQIQSVLDEFPEYEQYRDEISSFSSLLSTYFDALETNEDREAIKSMNSTELASRLSEFAKKRYNLYFPKGLLLIDTVFYRLNQINPSMSSAFSGVGELANSEKIDLLHHLSSRIGEDTSSGRDLKAQSLQVAKYFGAAGFDRGYVIQENVPEGEYVSILIHDRESGQFIRQRKIQRGRSSNSNLALYDLQGQSVSPLNVPSNVQSIINRNVLVQQKIDLNGLKRANGPISQVSVGQITAPSLARDSSFDLNPLVQNFNAPVAGDGGTLDETNVVFDIQAATVGEGSASIQADHITETGIRLGARAEGRATSSFGRVDATVSSFASGSTSGGDQFVAASRVATCTGGIEGNIAGEYISQLNGTVTSTTTINGVMNNCGNQQIRDIQASQSLNIQGEKTSGFVRGTVGNRSGLNGAEVGISTQVSSHLTATAAHSRNGPSRFTLLRLDDDRGFSVVGTETVQGSENSDWTLDSRSIGGRVDLARVGLLPDNLEGDLVILKSTDTFGGTVDVRGQVRGQISKSSNTDVYLVVQNIESSLEDGDSLNVQAGLDTDLRRMGSLQTSASIAQRGIASNEQNYSARATIGRYRDGSIVEGFSENMPNIILDLNHIRSRNGEDSVEVTSAAVSVDREFLNLGDGRSIRARAAAEYVTQGGTYSSGSNINFTVGVGFKTDKGREVYVDCGQVGSSSRSNLIFTPVTDGKGCRGGLRVPL